MAAQAGFGRMWAQGRGDGIPRRVRAKAANNFEGIVMGNSDIKLISVKPAPAGMRNTFGWVSADLGNGVCVFGIKLARRSHGVFGYGDSPGGRRVCLHPPIAEELVRLAFGKEALQQ